VTSDEFSWEVLSDAAEEAQMLYEPLAAARTLLPDLSEPDRQRVVERTLRALHGAGLIAFVRGGDPPGAAFADPDRHLGEGEVDAVISGPGWRTVPVGADGTKVWFAATEAGRKAYAEDAPPHVAARRGAHEPDSA
jgi:hypothetical protein